MQCEQCGGPIKSQRTVMVGGKPVPFPFCENCTAEMLRRMDAYPKKKPK